MNKPEIKRARNRKEQPWPSDIVDWLLAIVVLLSFVAGIAVSIMLVKGFLSIMGW